MQDKIQFKLTRLFPKRADRISAANQLFLTLAGQEQLDPLAVAFDGKFLDVVHPDSDPLHVRREQLDRLHDGGAQTSFGSNGTAVAAFLAVNGGANPGHWGGVKAGQSAAEAAREARFSIAP